MRGGFSLQSGGADTWCWWGVVLGVIQVFHAAPDPRYKSAARLSILACQDKSRGGAEQQNEDKRFTTNVVGKLPYRARLHTT